MTTSNVTGSNPQQSIYAALNGSAATSSSASSSSTNISTQDQFLKLLTTQLQNQDPLNPMDNAQMTSQLAQISTVTGITQLNATLASLMNDVSATQTMQAASLVGHGVIVPGSGITLTQGSPAIAGVSLANDAGSVTVTIKDANGSVVRTLNLGSLKAGTNDFQWDGTTDSGAAAAAGNYTFSVSAATNGTKVDATALTLGVVSSVTIGSSGPSLNVGSAGTFNLSDVKQII